MVSPFIKWEHSHTWPVPTQQDFQALAGGNGDKTELTYEIDISPKSEDHYLSGHTINGKTIFPGTGMCLCFTAFRVSEIFFLMLAILV